MRRIAVVGTLCAFAAFGQGTNEVRVLKVASFAARTAKLELGGEFPGAKGRLSYTGGVVRADFDFSNGGRYVWTCVGSFREGARRIGGWFRSEGGVRLRLRVVDAKGDFYLMSERTLPEGRWIRLDFDLSRLVWGWGPSKTAEARKSVKWPVRADFTIAGVKEKQRGALEMKDVSCETADATLRDWAFRLAPLPYGALYYPGDEIRTECGLCNLNADGAKPEVRLSGVRIADWQDKAVADLPITEQQGEIVLTAANLHNRFGAFTATVVGQDAAGQELELGRLRFARLSSREVRPCPWAGTCTHWTHGWGSGNFRIVDLIAAAGLGIVRTGPVWSGCEKKKGVYALPREYDTFVDRLGARGVKVNMVLAYGNKIYENPLDPEAFAGYCGWMADHFRGRVDRFEIWNEPNNFEVRKRYYRNGQSELVWVKKFIELTQRADDAIRAVRPDAVVAVASEDWDKFLDMMLTNGIARARNAVAFHPYCHSQHRPEREFFLRDFGAKHRAYAKSHGGADRWCITEAGWTTFSGKGKFWEVAGFYPKASLPGQAACIVRMYLSALESGCDYACQYDFRDDGPNPRNAEQNFGLVYHDCTPKPSFAAVAFLTRLLGPAEFGRDCSPEPKKYRVASFRRGGVPIYALWAVEGEREIEIPSDVRGGFVFDLMGNRRDLGNQTKLMLTETPIYAVGRR